MKNESRADRFKRVAEKRAEKALQAIRLLGNCSNKSSYEYTAAEVNKMLRAIEEETKTVKAKFKLPPSNKFTF